MAVSIDSAPIDPNAPPTKKPISFLNLAIGASLNMFEVSTLGQPFEVTKTHMAANRGDSMLTAIQKTYKRGGMFGFYQGLIPWAWIEAATKGSVLIFASSELDYHFRRLGVSNTSASILSGMGGGIAQAYTTMGFCTFMKTVEVTRHKDPTGNRSSIQIAREIWAREGIRGINKGVNAVAVRQMTNWGSRFGLSRIAEDVIRNITYGSDDKDRKNKPLGPLSKILASTIGGALSCWNQPIEVIRVEMQSQIKAPGRPEKMSIGSAAAWIYKNNGIKGFYRGVTPRVGLGVWQTVCMVFGGDQVKAYFAKRIFSSPQPGQPLTWIYHQNTIHNAGLKQLEISKSYYVQKFIIKYVQQGRNIGWEVANLQEFKCSIACNWWPLLLE